MRVGSSEKDRRLIRVASCQGKSGNEAKSVGVSNLNKENKMVYEAIEEYHEIKEAVNHIIQAKSSGMKSVVSNSSSCSNTSSEGESCVWLSDDDTCSYENSAESSNVPQLSKISCHMT